MLILHHGTTSVCSAKVRLVLHEKQIGWTGEVLDLQRGDQHQPDYVALNPNAVVPTLVDDANVIIESTTILEYLEDRFPEHPLMPVDPVLRAQIRNWMKLVDTKLHAATGSLTFATANRKILIRKSPEELEAHFARIPDPAYRERQRVAVELGLDAPATDAALKLFLDAFGNIEKALKSSAWVAGNTYSLADASLIPYVNRLGLLGMEDMWIDRLPLVCRWWEEAKSRPSFAPAMLDILLPKDHERFDIDQAQSADKLRKVLS
jgi:glutathione S-transferase